MASFQELGFLQTSLHSYFQGSAKAFFFPVVEQFTEALVQAVQMPDGPTSDSGLKMEVLKARELFCPASKYCRMLSVVGTVQCFIYFFDFF